MSDIKSVFNKIDINSIQVRKFNLDVCEDHQNETQQWEQMRVCLPIFTQDILDSLNLLDINSYTSSASKKGI